MEIQTSHKLVIDEIVKSKLSDSVFSPVSLKEIVSGVISDTDCDSSIHVIAA